MNFFKVTFLAGLLATVACGPNELDKPSQEFLQALQNQDTEATYAFFGESLKKDLDIEKWSEITKASKIVKWTQTVEGFDNSISYREYDVEFEGGGKATMKVGWQRTDAGLKIIGWHRSPIK
jgi:hypothetical protein